MRSELIQRSQGNVGCQQWANDWAALSKFSC